MFSTNHPRHPHGDGRKGEACSGSRRERKIGDSVIEEEIGAESKESEGLGRREGGEESVSGEMEGVEEIEVEGSVIVPEHNICDKLWKQRVKAKRSPFT